MNSGLSVASGASPWARNRSGSFSRMVGTKG